MWASHGLQHLYLVEFSGLRAQWVEFGGHSRLADHLIRVGFGGSPIHVKVNLVGPT